MNNSILVFLGLATVQSLKIDKTYQYSAPPKLEGIVDDLAHDLDKQIPNSIPDEVEYLQSIWDGDQYLDKEEEPYVSDVCEQVENLAQTDNQDITRITESEKCARENENCECDSGNLVYYGAEKNGKLDTTRAFKVLQADSSGITSCSNSLFGDPLGGVYKTCFCFDPSLNAKIDMGNVRPHQDAMTFVSSDLSKFSWVESELNPCQEDDGASETLLYTGNGATGGGQWRGWNQKPGTSKWLRQSAWVRFDDQIPAVSANFGFKIHGQVNNDYLNDMVPNEWKYVSYVGPATNGDAGYILFIFDTMGGKNGQKAYISQPSLEIFEEKPEPLEKPSCAFCSAEL